MQIFKRKPRLPGLAITAGALGAFAALMVALCLLAGAMSPSWQVEPFSGAIHVESSDTSIRAQGRDTPAEGTYHVATSEQRIALRDGVEVRAIVREPVGATGARPACLLIQGAGTAKASEAYGDVASAMASSGIVTMVADKRLDNYSPLHRDYPTMAEEYATLLHTLAAHPHVDAANTGVYAESEGTWVTTMMAAEHNDIAFMILTSPPVVSGRRQMTMAATAYLDYLGAPPSLVRDVPKFTSMDFSPLGIAYADTPQPGQLRALTMPLLVNYGTNDLSMPIEQGAQQIIQSAGEVGNHNVTVRYYPTNHQMRVGSRRSEPGLQLDKHYTHDLEAWINAVAEGADAHAWQTPMIAGAEPKQRFAAPTQAMTPGLFTSLGALITVVACTLASLLLAALSALTLTFRGRGHSRDRRHARFGRGVAPLLTWLGLVDSVVLVGFAWYMATVVKAAMDLSPQSMPPTLGWHALRGAALVVAALCAALAVRAALNHRAARLGFSQRAGDAHDVVLAQGFGHRCAVVSTVFASLLTLILMAFAGLFGI